MATITVQNVTKQFGGQTVLDNVSFDLHTGEVVGLVGPNGSGKTTLFRLIAGLIAPDVGTITATRGLAVAYLPQEPQVNLENTLLTEVAGVFDDVLRLERKCRELSTAIAENHDGPQADQLLTQYDRANERFIAAGGHTIEQRLNEVLGGLGFSQADRSLRMSALSGGQKCRAALAKVLLEKDRFLLLDEPTNHLDIDAVRWLERFLAGYHRGAVVISHDRYLLDRVAQKIIDVENRKITVYPGNYSNYVSSKQMRRLTQVRQYEKDRAFIEKERAFIAKHLAGQRTKEAQGRRARLDRRIQAGDFVLEMPTERLKLKLAFDNALPSGRTILAIDELSKRYGEKILFSDLRLEIMSGQRFGITGPNGTGKTTLLRIALGQVQPDTGTIELDGKAMIGCYAQEAPIPEPDVTVLDEIRDVRPDLSELEARSLLGSFFFRGEDVFKRVATLSGGEQSRVRLVKLILSGPNVLVLDEPTNHLDIPSREALEQALIDYPGTLIAVSHDRYFLDRIVERLLVIRPDGHAVYGGNYSFYIDQTEREQAPAQSVQAESKPRSKQRSPSTPKSARSEPSPYDALSIDEIQASIIEREEEIANLNARLADHTVHKDPSAVADVHRKIASLQRDLSLLEDAWGNRIDNL